MTKSKTPNAGAGKAAGAAALFPPLHGLATPADVGEAMAANRAVMDEFVAVNHDIGAFVGKRMRADAETFARLCHCRDWPEAVGVQVEFMSRLAEDYFSEMGRLMERTARMMESAPIRGAEAKKKVKKDK